MSDKIAPNLAYHFWGANIKNQSAESEPSSVGVFIRGSEFDHGKEIEMQDDEGHMGTQTIKVSSYRSKASANPSFTDKCRYKEGWEDMWLLLLGSGSHSDSTPYTIDKTTVTTGVYKYVFSVDTAQPNDPYTCALFNGFAKTSADAYKYENCLMSEFELSGSNTDAPTYKATFSSNFPKFNQTNPVRTYPTTTEFPKPANVKIYIAPALESGEYVFGTAGTGEVSIDDYMYGCYQDWSLNVNMNVEDQPCAGDDFGTSTKVQGNREGTFNITLPWNDTTKKLEYKFMGGADNSTGVTTENDVKTVWILMEGSTISSTYKYTTLIKIPHIVMTAVNSPQSGSDAKTLELEGNIEENGSDSFITTEIQTSLADLHITSAS